MLNIIGVYVNKYPSLMNKNATWGVCRDA